MTEEFQGTVRARKWGHSMVIVLPRELREFLGVVHRDLIAYRKVGRYVLLRRIRAGELVPVGDEGARPIAAEVKA